ncbi:MAG: hypothetical protein L6Q33_15445, partial [Bacteriovoracaceae bacterium]|nr:hypothetical protein [Bacteriovoracaceae bacterium]
MPVKNCKHFNGYKPCGKNYTCDNLCPEKTIVSKTILIIHLGAMGSVVRSSALLRKIKSEDSSSFVIWLTSSSVKSILEGHSAIDRLITLDFEGLLKLKNYFFDRVFVVDKSQEAVGVLGFLKYNELYGFVANPKNGAILPASKESEEIWELGIDNHKKFFVNKKSELQLIFESFGFTYQREDYWIELTSSEIKSSKLRKEAWLKMNHKKIILGINTGCSHIIPYKKLTVEKHLDLIKEISQNFPYLQIVLLGGREDLERNNAIKNSIKDVIQSDNLSGLRDGMISVNACDIVISGDSLGMHLGIAFKKFTIAWFGPTCEQEIDLFDLGVKIKTTLDCAPCWKRSCSQEKMCYDHVELEHFIKAV